MVLAALRNHLDSLLGPGLGSQATATVVTEGLVQLQPFQATAQGRRFGIGSIFAQGAAGHRSGWLLVRVASADMVWTAAASGQLTIR
jgi:hypothetical protein